MTGARASCARTGHALWRLPAVLMAVFVLGPVGPSTAGTLTAAPVTPYDMTPNCPVSPARPVCSWDVPSDSTNVFGALDYGECPYWAAEKYPALVLDAAGSDPLAGDWNGGTWIEHAQAEGLVISSRPAPGDLAVWQARPSDPDGHVAYVETVLPSGIVVSQMDGASAAPFPPMRGSTEYIPGAWLDSFAQTYGLAYLVTGDAPNTPPTYLERPDATEPEMTMTVSVPAPWILPRATPRRPGPGSRSGGRTPTRSRRARDCMCGQRHARR